MRCLLVLVALTTSALAADQTDPIDVRATLAGTAAMLDVRYRLTTPDDASYATTAAQLGLPPGAIVTGATLVENRVRHDFVLATAADTDAALAHLANTDADDHRQWLVALSSNGDQITVAAATEHRTTLDLRVTMRATTCFERDARYVALPDTWTSAGTAGEHCNASGRWLSFPARELVSRASGERIGVLADALQLRDHQIARVELDLSAKLGDVPADLATVIIEDNSRSLAPAERELERKTIDGYLAAAPASRVQVISFARTPAALLPDFAIARDVRKAIAHTLAGETARNGSNLDAALADAARWLARAPGTHRIVVLTDARLADRVRVEHLADLAGGALIHVVDLDVAPGTLHRDDDAPLARVALDTGGIAVRGGTDEAAFDPTMLVRPISLDHVAVSAPGWSSIPGLRDTCRDDLAEGASCSWWGRGDTAGPITLTGDVWGRRFSRVIRPDPAAGRDVARELAGAGTLARDPDGGAIALAAYAVDSAWSLLATWGGTGGYDDVVSSIGHHSGSSCCGDGQGFTDRAIGSVVELPPPLDAIDVQLARAIAPCKLPAGARVELTIELTRREIVDVAARVVPAGAAPAIASGDLHACIVDAVWNTDLAVEPELDHVTQRISVGG